MISHVSALVSCHEFLIAVFEGDSSLFPPTVKSAEDIRENYKVFRSFRRGSDTEATNRGVDRTDVEVVNRWQTEERANNKIPSLSAYISCSGRLKKSVIYPSFIPFLT